MRSDLGSISVIISVIREVQLVSVNQLPSNSKAVSFPRIDGFGFSFERVGKLLQHGRSLQRTQIAAIDDLRNTDLRSHLVVNVLDYE